MPFKIVVANPIHAPVLAKLQAHGEVVTNDRPEPWPREALTSACRDADALMAFMTETVDAGFLDACPSLKIVAGALKGYNNIDVDACTARSVAVTIVPDLLAAPTAELTIGLMIAAARNIGPGDRHVRSGDFRGWRPRFYGGSLEGSVVGVLGAGGVGQAILRMLKGFDCRRLYVDKRALTPDQESDLDAERATLPEVLAEADFVVLALHLMPSTLHLVDESFLSRMKRGSYLINPARGSLVDERAVASALASGHLAGYASDTFEMEDWARPDRPRTVDRSLIMSDRTVLTPHLGSAVATVREAIESAAADCVIARKNGQIPVGAVNRDALMMH